MVTKIILLLFILISSLFTGEIVVIANNKFPTNHINQSELKAIFLDNKHFIGKQKILPINYSINDPLRNCFEKNILKKSRKSLQRYWLKAHYNGKRPPKVVKSKIMLMEYLQKLPNAIGYIDANTSLNGTLKILLKVPCR